MESLRRPTERARSGGLLLAAQRVMSAWRARIIWLAQLLLLFYFPRTPTHSLLARKCQALGTPVPEISVRPSFGLRHPRA